MGVKVGAGSRLASKASGVPPLGLRASLCYALTSRPSPGSVPLRCDMRVSEERG